MQDDQGDVIEYTVKKKKISTHKIKPEDQQLYHVLKQSSVYVKSVGGVGSRMEVSQRGSAAHQQGLYLDMIPLHNVRSQSLDLSLFPSSMLSHVMINSGGDATQGGSGELSGRVTLMPRDIPRAQSWQIQAQSSTERAQQIALYYGKNHDRWGWATHFALAGGDHAYLYRNQHHVMKRRVNANFAQLSMNGQIKHESHWSLMNALIGFGHLARGEPGPDGIDVSGRQSQQQFYYSGIKLKLKHIQSLSLKAYTTIHQYRFMESNPLWQSQANINAQYQDRRWGIESDYHDQYQWGYWGSYIQAQWTKADTKTFKAQQQQLALALYHQWGRSSLVRLKKNIRFDLNDQRAPQWIPSVTLSIHQQPFMCSTKASQVFRDPGFDEKYLEGPGILPNPQLKNEWGWWIDGGCEALWKLKKFGIQHLYRLNIRFFKQHYERMILYMPLDPYRVQVSDQFGAEIKGMELQSKNRWYLQSQVMKRLEINASLTWQKHQLNVAPFTALPLRPTFYGSLFFTAYTLAQLKYWIHLDMRNQMNSDRFALRTLPSSYLWNIGIGKIWPWNHRQIHTSMQIRNLFNQNTQDMILRPLPGRSIWITFSVAYDE